MAKTIPVGDKTLSAETIVDDLTSQVVGIRFLLDDEEIPEEEARRYINEYNAANPNG
jgi:hypothetical protein